jgi:C1A family cysteine protease
MIELNLAVIEEARAQSIASSDNHSLAPTASDSSTSSSNSSQVHRPYRTPALDRQRSASSYSTSTSSHGDGTHSPQTARTAPEERSPGLFDMPRTPSLRSQSETGSVLIHEAVARSPSTILPNSSASSSLRSARSVIRLHPHPSEGELPYQYTVDAG